MLVINTHSAWLREKRFAMWQWTFLSTNVLKWRQYFTQKSIKSLPHSIFDKMFQDAVDFSIEQNQIFWINIAVSSISSEYLIVRAKEVRKRSTWPQEVTHLTCKYDVYLQSNPSWCIPFLPHQSRKIHPVLNYSNQSTGL